MGKLVYWMTASLDGYVNDADGNFDWGAPDKEVHDFILREQRGITTFLFGRRMFETMRVWDDDGVVGEMGEPYSSYAPIYRAADKIVFSSTLEPPANPRTRLERTLDPDTVRDLKRRSDADLEVAGPTLAAIFLKAGLVDELVLFVAPFVVGGGTRVLPDGLGMRLELVDQRRFTSGTVYLRYAILS